MAALQNILHACGADEKRALAEARMRSAEWDSWLIPLASNQGAGEDPGYDDDFQRIREEVNKLSGIDTALICQLAEKLLKTTCKDLRVLTFYAWARLHQEGESGFAHGLELLAAMLDRYGAALHPQRERSRKSALEWLGSSRVTDSLSLYPEVDMAVMQRMTAALVLAEETFLTFDEAARPELAGLYQALDNRLVQSGGANSLVPQTSREESGAVDSATAEAPVMSTVTSGRDLLDQAKVLAKYLRDQPGGWLAGHHLLKSVRWDTLTELPPLDAAGRTRLTPPKPDNKAHLKRLWLQKSWSELLEHTDTLLEQGVNHLWLDVQWYSWQALTKLDADTVQGFGEDDTLWPTGSSSFSGYQLLLEYFTFREKFMFTGLHGLETVSFPAGLRWFEIDVVLAERWDHDFSFTEKHLRLNCVPVINLFPLESDPLTLNSLQTEYMLRPMRVQDGHTEIYAVDSVISSSQHTYVPFSSFRHKGGMMRHQAPEYYYHTRVRRGPSGLHNTWLILGGEAFDNHTVPADESLSLTLTGTNGQLPRRALQSTVLDTVMKTTSASIAVRNLCAPTLPCYPPAQDRFHWRVLSHLGSSFLSMMDSADVLRGTLALYEWTHSEMNRRRLEAITGVKHSETERFEQGYLVRGVQIEVTLDSHGFAGRGDICLFGEMLSRFFALYTDIYLFNRLIIILQPTGERLEWQEKHNRRIPG